MDRLYEARQAYSRAFGNEGPRPSGVSDEDLAEALEQAVQAGVPIPDNRDWSMDLPSAT
jgi:hypothetical protein